MSNLLDFKTLGQIIPDRCVLTLDRIQVVDSHNIYLQNPGFPQGLRIRIHFIRIRIQHFRLNTNPDRIRIQSRLGSSDFGIVCCFTIGVIQ